jgi:antitoxin MazE
MNTNIILIGNSNGVILPADMLRLLQLKTKSAVSVSVENDKIIIRSSPRQGWADAAKQMVQAGDDELLLSDFFKEEDLSWWTWDGEKK